MKYTSLKRQKSHSFKVEALNGGINNTMPRERIGDNEIADCKNMWYNEGYLKTRPGFKADIKKAFEPQILGFTGDLKYEVIDSDIWIDGENHKIATANILTDDYAHYTYVYLIDESDNVISLGHMAFLRLSSDVFYQPENILFFCGKSQGGGIFAFVTLRNQYDYSQKNYYIYEINADYTEWERVYDYYVPTIFINGRGNKYKTAKLETGITPPEPKTLESQNVLNGRFNVYFTSDGYSTSFKLPFANLSYEKIICRIYYNFSQFVEWEISADANTDTQEFYGQSVKAVIDREIGALYFVGDDGEFAIPVMDLYNENNIKITASKEIENGFCKIVHSTCCKRHNTRLAFAGGEDGNTVYFADSDNPLYFPMNCSIKLGNDTDEVTALSVLGDNILAFKQHETYAISLKEGNAINTIALLHDNDKVFKAKDSIDARAVSQTVGCNYKGSVANCGGKTLWLGSDGTIYAIISINGGAIPICSCLDNFDLKPYKESAFAVGNESHYLLVTKDDILVCDLKDIKEPRFYLWQKPQGIKIESGFHHNGAFKFLCTDLGKRIVFVAGLKGDSDTVLSFDENDVLTQAQLPISSSITTKHYDLGDILKRKDIDSVYLTMAAHGKVNIGINGKPVAKVNFAFSNEDYGNCNYKAIKLLPHIHNVDGLYFDFCSEKQMSIGEMEIIYRLIG